MKSKVQSPTSFVKSTMEVKKSKVIEMRAARVVSGVQCRGAGRGVPTAPSDVRATGPGALGTPRPAFQFGPGGGLGTPRPAFATRDSSGVALVITLILLSVITFMAITFLVVSRGEKSTVSSITEQTTARLAAEQALEVAQSEMIAPMLAFTNPNIGLLVSTNYINSAGFNTAPALRGYLTNVSYAYPNGTPLNNFNDLCQNIANLYYLARVPVFATNRITRSNDFVYYLDLNRNGRYDTNGILPVMNPLGGFYNTNGQPIAAIIPGNTLSNSFRGDPEWVGVLERANYTPGLYNIKFPRQIFPVGMAHSADNQFISRYAYIVIPTSEALDINYMHNYAKELPDSLMSFDGFWRNQGVGSWEINLAAFLTDLNTNTWDTNTSPYVYNKNYPAFIANSGFAFDDAVSLLRYRYGRRWLNLQSVPQNFDPLGVNPPPGSTAFRGDYIDGYTYGLMAGAWWTPPGGGDIDATRLRFSWPGSDNPSNYFDMQDLMDRNKAVPNVFAPIHFADRMQRTGNGVSSYDRYTFYRLLEQLGTDSAPETRKINLNYVNVDNTGDIAPNLATNFTPWQPVQFFTNSAARMLADAGYGTNIVDFVGGVPRIHIQIYPANYYTPSVHRYLQVAANIYDANANIRTTINAPYPATGNGFPSVFRPVFYDELGTRGGTNRVWIVDYSEVTNLDLTLVSTNVSQIRPFHDLNNPLDRRPVRNFDMVYGVPLVVGAKKGFPNFNEFGLLQDLIVSRNLHFHRLGAGNFNTNQVYTMGISNVFSVEAWNSYFNPYTNQLQMIAIADVVTAVTNEAGICRDMNNVLLTNVYTVAAFTNIPANSWAGFRGANVAITQLRASFRFPLAAQSYLFLTNSDFAFNQNRFLPPGSVPTDPVNYFPVPRWKVKLTARARFALIDVAAQRIIDYVNLSEVQDPVDVAQVMQGADNGGDARCDGNFNGEIGSLFCTQRVSASVLPTAPTYGIVHQYGISMGAEQVSDAFWRAYNTQTGDKAASINTFRQRILSTSDPTLDFAAPFSPRRIIHHSISWQANDPLVHYVAGDLQDPLSGKRKISYDTINGLIDPTSNPLVGFPLPGQTTQNPLNQHYRPWGGRPNSSDSDPPTATHLGLKDPLMFNSDSWSFMSNRFANIGWLGRVHRGTPWQTVFLKATNVNFQTWTNWVGNNYMLVNYDDRGSSNYDAIFSYPTNDYRLMDLFTTAFNDNASKGQLSVNQTNLAAWSAILSGVIVNTNGTTNGFTWIEPAGVYDPATPPPLVRIVNGINRTRANPTNFPYGGFLGRGDILSVPELTMASPYIPNVTNATPSQALPDWVYERIPQQIMGLLRGADEPPRYVIYAFGQALKPAEHSLVTSGPFLGLCTNYQVTAESVVRAVVRVDNAPTPRAPNNIPRVYVESFNVLAPY